MYMRTYDDVLQMAITKKDAIWYASIIGIHLGTEWAGYTRATPLSYQSSVLLSLINVSAEDWSFL